MGKVRAGDLRNPLRAAIRNQQVATRKTASRTSAAEDAARIDALEAEVADLTARIVALGG